MSSVRMDWNHLPAGCLALPELEGFLAEHLKVMVNGRPRLSGVDLTGASLAGVRLSGVRLDGVSLRGADLRGAVLSDVILDHCDLAGARLEGGQWHQVSGRYVIADDTHWGNAVVKQCHFMGSFRRADFTGVTWEDVHFYSSDLRGSRGTLPEGVRGGVLRVGGAPHPLLPQPQRETGLGH